jgi:glutamate dehydrogenase/leucine dehydrogenase
VAIQGFGNVGYWFAKKCYEKGLKVVAIGDKIDATYDPNGLDVNACKLARDAGQEWPVGDRGSPPRKCWNWTWTSSVPAAIENVITSTTPTRSRPR